MFQTVEPKQIFDSAFWQVSEEYPSYWLAQLRKADWLKLLEFISVKVSRSAKKPVLVGLALNRLEFEVCDTRLDAYKTWQTNPGSIVTWCCASNTGTRKPIGHAASRKSCRQTKVTSLAL